MKFDAESNRQCIYCHNFCKFCCPSFDATKDHKILETNKNYLLYLQRKQAVELSPADGLSFFLCNDCRRCEQFCWDSDKKVLANNRVAKEAALKAGVAPPVVYDIKNNLEKYGNFYQPETESKPSSGNKQYDIYVYAGEYARYFDPQLIRQFGRIVESMGLSYIYDNGEISSGLLARDLGMEEVGLELMKKNYEQVNSYNFRQLITLAPEDYYAFSYEYVQKGLKFSQPVLHYTQFLSANLDALNPLTGEQLKYIYFDPCKLGRYCDIYDEPRKVLTRLLGDGRVELFRNRQEASCCAGYIRLIDETVARKMADQLISQCRASGCGLLITACPLCLSNLKMASENNAMEVVDIIELAGRGIKSGA